MNNYVLAAGRTDTFYVRADVVGMDNATGDTIQFTVRYPEDINAVEASTLFGVSHNLDTAFSQGGLNGVVDAIDDAVIYTINGGDTTFVKSSTAPSAQTKPRGATGVTFLESNLIVKQEFTTDAIKLSFYSNVDATVTVPPAPPGVMPAGTAATATATAIDLKNLKLYVDSSLVQTKSGDLADFTSCVNDATLGANGIKCTLNFDSTVILKQGTRTIKLIGDIEQNAVSGHKFRAEIAGATAFLSAKYTANDRPISAVAGTVTGGDVTVGSSNLTITENSGYSPTQTFVAGAQNLMIAKYTVKANDSDDVTVTRMKFGLIGASTDGQNITSASLYVNGVQNGSTKSFTTGVAGTVEFNDLNFKVPSNTQVTITLQVNLTNSANGAGTTTLRVALQQMDAKDSSSTDANINGVTPMVAINAIALTITGSGILTASNNSNTAPSKYLVAGTSEQEIGKFTLAAQNDDIKVTNLYLMTQDGAGAATNIASSVSTIALYGNDGTKLADGIVNGNYVYFDMGDSSKLIVAKGVNNYTITVKATFNTINDATQSGKKIYLALGDGAPVDAVTGTINAGCAALPGVNATACGIRAVSMGNNNTLTTAAKSGTVRTATNLQFLTKSSLTLASIDDPSLLSQTAGSLTVGTDIKTYAFSATADANSNVDLGSVILNLNYSGAGADITGVKVYDMDNPGIVLYNNPAFAFATQSQLAFTSPYTINAGQTKKFIVALTLGTITPVAPATKVSLAVKLAPGVGDAAFGTGVYSPAPTASATLWSDFSDPAHTATTLDWFVGYKINGLDNMGQRTYSSP